jgi:hypothetical protein
MPKLFNEIIPDFFLLRILTPPLPPLLSAAVATDQHRQLKKGHVLDCLRRRLPPPPSTDH